MTCHVPGSNMHMASQLGQDKMCCNLYSLTSKRRPRNTSILYLGRRFPLPAEVVARQEIGQEVKIWHGPNSCAILGVQQLQTCPQSTCCRYVLTVVQFVPLLRLTRFGRASRITCSLKKDGLLFQKWSVLSSNADWRHRISPRAAATSEEETSMYSLRFSCWFAMRSAGQDLLGVLHELGEHDIWFLFRNSHPLSDGNTTCQSRWDRPQIGYAKKGLCPLMQRRQAH